MNHYGCHNTPRMEGYWARDTKLGPGGILLNVQTFIEDKASVECRYDQREKDRKCGGCEKGRGG